ncbi:MAG: threonine--tRNA ligase [Rickettsiales bacterium]|jgi:threonyl-tRNA synthetase|nr:threonine--tRNA ligase [Rickettsiales bacterium]
MVTITLPDGSTREYPAPVTGAEIAASIGAGLAKAALAMKVDGIQRDLYLPVEHNAKIEILTPKQPEGLDILRHTTTAQVLARAMKELYPGSKLAIGPTVDDGFYYDVETPNPISSEELAKIEACMREIMAEDQSVTREMWEREAAIKLFESRGEPYKAEIIRSAPDDDTTEKGKISLYRQGSGDAAFIDLCRGPHAPHFRHLSPHFKLMRVAGAYWRGDSRNKQLTRIYGVQFATEKELKNYLTMLEEAEKRDHRKLGRELGLFHIEEHSPGMIFWHDKGWTLYRTLEQFVRSKLQTRGYIEVKTPTLVDRSLWEASGHWEKFRENMFVAPSDEDKVLAVKPMNCPCHVQIFNQGLKSYRELPLRMAEFGSCHRNEPSGSLHGIMRIRGFTQDDAHIFCMEDQITSETIAFCDLLKEVYRAFGFTEIQVKFSDRPPTRAGSDATWDKAETALKDAVNAAGLDWTLNPGEGAFYGPKLEFVLRDALGRDWQCGTLQVDFVLPERLDAQYIGADGNKHRPVMLHRAILGSLERFIGILIEQYAGKFPLWLSPVQAMVATITDAAIPYAEEVQKELRASGIRADLDVRNEKINYKVREHSVNKVPLMLVVGAKEAEQKSVSIRRLGSDKQETMTLAEAKTLLTQETLPPS